MNQTVIASWMELEGGHSQGSFGEGADELRKLGSALPVVVGYLVPVLSLLQAGLMPIRYLYEVIFRCIDARASTTMLQQIWIRIKI